MAEKLPNQEKLPKSLELARELENTDDVNVLREKLGELLESISRDIGVNSTSEIGKIYREMQSENCLARIETLSRVLETVELSAPMPISDEAESHYANAVVPEPDGLKIAFSEGQAPGPVRTVVGFGKTLIGFKTDHVSVSEVDFTPSEIRNVQSRKRLCRHVVGNLDKNDIRFIVMRIPSDLLSQRHLTKDEQTKKPNFIFRGFRLATN